MTSTRQCRKGLKEKCYQKFQSVQPVSGLKIKHGTSEIRHSSVAQKLGTKRRCSISSHNPSVCLHRNPSCDGRRPGQNAGPDTSRNGAGRAATTQRHSVQVLWAKQSKDKVCPGTGHEGPEGQQRYSSSLSLTSVRAERKISSSPGFDPRTVHTVASRYTD